MPQPVTIKRTGATLTCDTPAGVVTLQPSSADRTALRWWRAVDSTGKAVTPWLSTPKIAACFATAQCRSTPPNTHLR